MSKRSAYIDDLNPFPGTQVVCKEAIEAPNFTPGKIYTYIGEHKLIDDRGDVVISSARFYVKP